MVLRTHNLKKQQYKVYALFLAFVYIEYAGQLDLESKQDQNIKVKKKL